LPPHGGAVVTVSRYGARVSFDVVVAADLDWGIGKNNGLPWPKLKADMAHFRRITSAAADGKLNAILMGRKTWQSQEMAGVPLPKRLNVVITRQGVTVPEGVVVAASLDAALMAARGDNIEGVFVIGGAEIIREAVGHAELRWIYMTRIEARFGCEVFIPDLDALGFIKVEWDGEQVCEDNGVSYRIERLARPAVP
jgi:dihydrofolate reductase / thymidylate synthase